jgi:cytoskeletal protein CcmA (bactofilin family)
MSVVLTVSLLLGTLASIGAQRVYVTRRHIHRTKAQAIAEAGIDYAYSVLQTNFAQRTNAAAFPPTAFAGGTFDVTVVPVSNDVAIIYSAGQFGVAAADVAADARDYGVGVGGPGGAPIDPAVFDFAVLCGGTFDFGGCGTVTSTNGTVLFHANGEIAIKGSADVDLDIESSVLISIGNNHVLGGDVTAPELDYNPDNVTIAGDATEEPVPLVTIPDIDLTPYYNWALAHGEVKNGWTTSSSYTPNGGIVWVNGNVQISSYAVINGTIIATGDIHISGTADVRAGDTAFSLVSRDGSIQNTSSGTIEGLIYVKTGNYDQTANGTMIGQLIVGGNIKKGGNSDIIVFKRIVPAPPDMGPGGPGSGTSIIGISAWSK